jgi:plasmid stabilization system protein ParE
MAPPLVFRRGVGRDLAAAYAWYEEQQAGLGEQFLAEVNSSFDAVEQFPEMFAPVYGDVRRALVSRFPYAVFYRVERRQVLVLTVLHTARDPQLWPKPRGKAR